MDNSEKIIFTNSFGTVSDKQVIVHYKNDSEIFPLKQISSVSFDRKRNIPFAIIFFIVGFAILFVISIWPELPGVVIGGGLILIVLSVLIGIAYYIGNYKIKLSAAGRDPEPIRIELARAKEGREFFNAIKKQITFTE